MLPDLEDLEELYFLVSGPKPYIRPFLFIPSKRETIGGNKSVFSLISIIVCEGLTSSPTM